MTVGTIDEVNTAAGTVSRRQKGAAELPGGLSICRSRHDNHPRLTGRQQHLPSNIPIRSPPLLYLPRSCPMAQAGADYIPTCLFRVEKAQGQSIGKDLYLTQVHDIQLFFLHFNLLQIAGRLYCASPKHIPFWAGGVDVVGVGLWPETTMCGALTDQEVWASAVPSSPCLSHSGLKSPLLCHPAGVLHTPGRGPHRTQPCS